MIKCLLNVVLFITLSQICLAEDGYRLWLRYDRITDNNLLQQYRKQISSFRLYGSSPTLAAAKKELETGLSGLLGRKYTDAGTIATGSLIVYSRASAPALPFLKEIDYAGTGAEGFIIKTIRSGGNIYTVITAGSDIGVLYGVFHFLRQLQTLQPVQPISLTSAPKIQNRILDHWDNLNRTIERGYAGFSIWNWHTLPDYIDQRYIDYARANASIGINGTVLTNVNANSLVLTPAYLVKVKALADV
ncbi:MAG: alpha-glucuronidase, partial [Bacteroidetes bacterium]|nr:alpha-glucuronidase [Bacteroidota bacterium]